MSFSGELCIVDENDAIPNNFMSKFSLGPKMEIPFIDLEEMDIPLINLEEESRVTKLENEIFNEYKQLLMEEERQRRNSKIARCDCSRCIKKRAKHAFLNDHTYSRRLKSKQKKIPTGNLDQAQKVCRYFCCCRYCITEIVPTSNLIA